MPLEIECLIDCELIIIVYYKNNPNDIIKNLYK